MKNKIKFRTEKILPKFVSVGRTESALNLAFSLIGKSKYYQNT